MKTLYPEGSDFRPALIGITGAARAGKDTLGSGLALHAGFVRLSFAQPIRAFVADLLGLTVPELEPIKEVSQSVLGGKTPRFAMQTLGTEWGRCMMDSDLWVRAAITKAAYWRDQGRPVAITDVRFPNEAEAIRDAGGDVIKITRPGYGLSGQASVHVSEQGIPKSLVSVELVNNADRDSLVEQALRCLGYDDDFSAASRG